MTGEPVPEEDGGGWLIDPSELIRLGVEPRQSPKSEPDNDPDNLTAFDKGLQGKVDALEKAVSLAEALAEERLERIEELHRLLPSPDRVKDLERELDEARNAADRADQLADELSKSKDAARDLAALLEQERSKTWWQKLRGK